MTVITLAATLYSHSLNAMSQIRKEEVIATVYRMPMLFHPKLSEGGTR